jgi:hypothetical protein
MTNLELAKQIRSNFFADRDTLEKAFDYVNDVIGNNPQALVAMFVVLNTVSKIIIANETAKESV